MTRKLTYSRLAQLALVVLLLAGAALRLTGVQFGLPYLYNPDEPNFVKRALRVLGNRDLNPGWFGHPGTVTIYSLSLLFGAFGAVGLASGWFRSPGEIEAIVRTDPSSFYLLGRLLMVAFALLTLAAVYRLGTTVSDQETALVATALLAVAPLHVELSRLIRPDMQMTLLVLIVVLLALRIAREGHTRDYVLAGLCLGLAATAKYPAVVGAVPIVVAHVVHGLRAERFRWSDSGKLAAAGAAAVLGAFAGSPYLFLDWRTALHDVLRENRAEHLSATSSGFLPSLAWYVSVVLRANFTIAGLCLAIVGAVALLRRKDAGAGWVVVSFPVAFLPFISAQHLRWDRWALPLLPFVALLAAMGWTFVRERARATSLKAKPIAWGVILLLWLALPFGESLLRARELHGGDTRTEAGKWILDHVPPGATILLERYTPQLPSGRYRLLEVKDGRIVPLAGARTYLNSGGVIGDVDSPEAIPASGAAYVVIGNDYDRRLAEAERYERSLEPYRLLFERYDKLYELEPRPGELAGNPIRVFRKR